MPRIMTFTMEVNDAEFANFLAQVNARATPVDTDVAPVAQTEDEGPVNTSAPTLDKNGTPWLADFHASTKAVNNDGTWRRKRGVDGLAAEAAENAARANVPNITANPENRVDPAAAVPPMPTFTMPTLPMPAAVEPPKPVTYEEIATRVQGILTTPGADQAALTQKIMAGYGEIGLTDVNALTTNETMRAMLKAFLDREFPVAG